MAGKKTKSALDRAKEALKLEKIKAELQQAKLDSMKRDRQEKAANEVADTEKRRRAAEANKLEAEAKKIGAEAISAEIAAKHNQVKDFENGEYMFFDFVRPRSVEIAIQRLNELSRRFPKKPLTIILNSPGGYVTEGLALYDHIRDLSRRGHHMTVKIRGMAASMGGILLQAGDRRVIGAEAEVLIHEVSGGTYGKVSKMEEDVRRSRHLWERLARILARRSTMTAEEIVDKSYKFDWWLEAEEAVQLGFAD
jgi:ATP-dependent Clp endopeptidase proteolytic subunit ClpP